MVYIEPETGKQYRYVTNDHHLKATEVADIYKERWQTKQFLKWIKQNLKIKTFLATSENAVLTQVWIALCVYLLVAFLKLKVKLSCSMTQILRVYNSTSLLEVILSDFLSRQTCKMLILRSFHSGAKL